MAEADSRQRDRLGRFMPKQDRCGRCGAGPVTAGFNSEIVWSLLAGKYLCADCLLQVTHDELTATKKQYGIVSATTQPTETTVQ